MPRRAADETIDVTYLADDHAREERGALLLHAVETLLVVWDWVVTTVLGHEP